MSINLEEAKKKAEKANKNDKLEIKEIFENSNYFVFIFGGEDESSVGVGDGPIGISKEDGSVIKQAGAFGGIDNFFGELKIVRKE